MNKLLNEVEFFEIGVWVSWQRDPVSYSLSENKRFIRWCPADRKWPIGILSQECLKIWRFHSIAMNDVTSYGKVHNWMLFWDVILVNLFENFKITSMPHSHSDNVFYIHTSHGPINLPIPALSYFINTLDSQSSGRARGGPNYFKVGGLFYKICTYLYANFRKKISSDTS